MHNTTQDNTCTTQHMHNTTNAQHNTTHAQHNTTQNKTIGHLIQNAQIGDSEILDVFALYIVQGILKGGIGFLFDFSVMLWVWQHEG